MPEGNTSEQAQKLYNYLYGEYFHRIVTDRTQILWWGPFWVALFASLLIVSFFLLAYHFNRVHRRRGELYGASSFAGSLMERVGPVSVFTLSMIGGTTLWALFYILTLTLNGLVY